MAPLLHRAAITRHRASTSTRWHCAFGAIATKPVHRLQIRPIVHN